MEFSGRSLVGVFLRRFDAEVGRVAREGERVAPRPPDHRASHLSRYA